MATSFHNLSLFTAAIIISWLTSHNLDANCGSNATFETSHLQQLLKYAPEIPSNSGAVAQYTVVLAACC